MRKTWAFIYYILIFASFAFVGPFVVLYYQDLGFSGSQIGVIAGLTPLITLVGAPLWTGLADARQQHRLVLSLTLLASSLVMALFPFFRTYAAIFVMAVLLQVFFSPVSSLADSATMHMLGDEKALYGRIRLGGTIGFGVAAALAGSLVQNFGLKSAFWVSSLLMFTSLLVSQQLSHSSVRADSDGQRDLRKLMSNPRWLLFLSVAFAAGLGMSVTNSYLLPFMKELGAHETLMGLTLTLGTLSEIPVLFFGNRLVQRFTPYGLVMLAMLVTGGRFLLFALAGTPALIVFLQLFAGLTFGAMWIGAVAYAQENAPPGLSASAQGQLNAMIFGIGAAVGGFSGGLLLEKLGGSGMYLVLGIAILSIVGLAAFLQARLTPSRQIAA